MAHNNEKAKYLDFLKNLMAACVTRGAKNIDYNEERLTRGVEKALGVVRQKGIKARFDMGGFDPAKFWETGYDCRVFDASTRGTRDVRLDFDNEKEAYGCLRFNGLSEEQIEAYRAAARVFIIEMQGGQGAQPTKYCMRAVGYKGIRGRQRY